MIEITPSFSIDDGELQFTFVRSSGPGGQNVNKVATAAQLRFDLNQSTLPGEVKERLRQIAANKITTEGELIIEAKRFRTQEQNREDALNRFVELLRRAFERPKPRRKTKPTAASQQRRLKQKKQRGEIKKSRQERTYE
jgi:ribosome-associated protein